MYFDNNASTPIDPLVLDVYLRACRDLAGNASSPHRWGRRVRLAVDQAREELAELLGAQPDEIIFTSGATESNNLAILGSHAILPKEARIALSTIEHKAVIEPCRHAERSGRELVWLGVDRCGRVDLDGVRAAVESKGGLLSVMLANNDTGVIQDIPALAELVHARGWWLHCDAAQALGKMPVDVNALGVDMLSLSGHKFHGPRGVGALYLRRSTMAGPERRLLAQLWGGRQERSLRAGTENVEGIVAMGHACMLLRARLDEKVRQVKALRDRLEGALRAEVPRMWVNGEGAERLPNTLNAGFEGLDGVALVVELDLCGLACSTGAACSSMSDEASHVLLAMGQSEREARSSVRLSLSVQNTAEEVERAIPLIVAAISRVRAWAAS
ncbi:MAG: cysteine desulfurase family protein [Myxococcota bacterium]|jgi:cysteine desulfurase|nr:cysteine desulfurase family protein [Myxococcota bacterium]